MPSMSFINIICEAKQMIIQWQHHELIDCFLFVITSILMTSGYFIRNNDQQRRKIYWKDSKSWWIQKNDEAET